MKQNLKMLLTNLDSIRELGRSVNTYIGSIGKTWAMKGASYNQGGLIFDSYLSMRRDLSTLHAKDPPPCTHEFCFVCQSL